MIELRTKKMVDFYVGGTLIGILKPMAWLLGRLLKRRRDQPPRIGARISFIKMLGGGSLVIAYPALLGLRRQYPTATFSLMCVRGVKPFAESLGVFDRIDEIDDSSFLHLVKSSLGCLWKNFLVDTVVDLEVHSRLTTVLSTLTGARNRVGFYLESVFWRKHLHTIVIFFNRYSGIFRWYDAVGRLFGAEPASIEDCRRLFRERLGPLVESSAPVRRIAIGHSSSELGRERMLNEQQWLSVFQEHLSTEDQAEVLLLGAPADRNFAEKIIHILERKFSSLYFRNLCGELSLIESVRLLAVCQEFWGIDSGLLHYARLLGLRCVSYWGPTDPTTRLRTMQGLKETVHYTKVPCSPCIHVTEEPPCKGNNVCIQSHFDDTKDYDSLSWLA